MRELVYETLARKRKPRGVTAKARAKRKRADDKYAKAVRFDCEQRDGYCRYGTTEHDFTRCGWPAEWAHMGEKTRAKTRGMAPEARHTTADSLILCKSHHDAYDGRRRPRLRIEALTPLGADGPLRFVLGAGK